MYNNSKLKVKSPMENWYQRRLSEATEIAIEAGMKEDLMGGILAAVVFVLGGSSIYNAAIKAGVSEQEVAEGLQTRELVDQAKSKLESGKLNKPPVTKPISAPSAPLNLFQLASMISNHEGGLIEKPYRDSRGLWTIGIGFNLEDPNANNVLAQAGIKSKAKDIISGKVKLSPQQLQRLFNHSLEIAFNDARKFLPNFDELPSEKKMVVVDMAYNMGYPVLSQFKRFQKALINKDYNEAKKEMKNSRWYNQVKSRGEELVEMMEKS